MFVGCTACRIGYADEVFQNAFGGWQGFISFIDGCILYGGEFVSCSAKVGCRWMHSYDMFLLINYIHILYCVNIFICWDTFLDTHRL
jgi:hypothetical protein